MENINNILANQKESDLFASKLIDSSDKFATIQKEKKVIESASKKKQKNDYRKELSNEFQIIQENTKDTLEQIGLKHNQNIEDINLSTKQAKETAINESNNKEEELRLQASLDILNGKKSIIEANYSLSDNIKKNNLSLEQTLDYNIPLKQKQLLEANDLNTNHSYELNNLKELQQLRNNIRTSELIKKQIEEELELTKETDEQLNRLIKANINSAFANSYLMAADDKYDLNASYGGWFNGFASSSADLIDNTLSLFSGIAGGDKITATKDLFRWLGLNKHNIYELRNQQDFFDRATAGYITYKFFESAPHFLSMAVGGGVLMKGLQVARSNFFRGKLLEGLDLAISKASKLGKNTKELEAMKAVFGNPNAMIKKETVESVLGSILGSKTAISNLSKTNILGILRNMPKYGYIAAGLGALDALTRINEQRTARGDSANLKVADVITGLTNWAVDAAGIIIPAGLVNKTLPKLGDEVLEGGLKQLLTGSTKIDKAKGLAKFGGTVLGESAVEGVGEVIQTYNELQAASNYTLPTLVDMLMSKGFDREKDQLLEAGVIGGILGGVMAGGANVISDGVSTVSDAKDKYIKQTSEAKQQADTDFKVDDYNKNFESNKFDEAKKELKSVANRIESKTEQTSLDKDKSKKESAIKNSNETTIAKLEQEEYKINKQLQEKQKELANEKSKDSATKNLDSVKKLEEEIAELTKTKEEVSSLKNDYIELDERKTSMLGARAVEATFEEKGEELLKVSKTKEDLDNVITKLANAKSKEERAEAVSELIDTIEIPENVAKRMFNDMRNIKDAKGYTKWVDKVKSKLPTRKSKDEDIIQSKASEKEIKGNIGDANNIDSIETNDSVEEQSIPNDNNNIESELEEFYTDQVNNDKERYNAKKEENNTKLEAYLKDNDPDLLLYYLGKSLVKTKGETIDIAKEFDRKYSVIAINNPELDLSSHSSNTRVNTPKDKPLKTSAKSLYLIKRDSTYIDSNGEVKRIFLDDGNTLANQIEPTLERSRKLYSDSANKIDNIIKDIQKLNNNPKDEELRKRINNDIKKLEQEVNERIERLSNDIEYLAFFMKDGDTKLAQDLGKFIANINREIKETQNDYMKLIALGKDAGVITREMNKGNISSTKGVLEFRDLIDITNLGNNITTLFSGLKDFISKASDVKVSTKQNQQRMKFFARLSVFFSKLDNIFNKAKNEKLKYLMDRLEQLEQYGNFINYKATFKIKDALGQSQIVNINPTNEIFQIFDEYIYDFLGYKDEHTIKNFLYDKIISLALKNDFETFAVSKMLLPFQQIQIPINKAEIKYPSTNNTQTIKTTNEIDSIVSLYDLLTLPLESIKDIFTDSEIENIINKDNNGEYIKADGLTEEILDANRKKFKQALDSTIFKQGNTKLRARIVEALSLDKELNNQLDTMLKAMLIVRGNQLAFQKIANKEEFSQNEANNDLLQISTLEDNEIGKFFKLLNMNSNNISNDTKADLYSLASYLANEYLKNIRYIDGNNGMVQAYDIRVPVKNKDSKVIAVPNHIIMNTSFRRTLRNKFKNKFDLLNNYFEKDPFANIENITKDNINKKNWHIDENLTDNQLKAIQKLESIQFEMESSKIISLFKDRLGIDVSKLAEDLVDANSIDSTKYYKLVDDIANSEKLKNEIMDTQDTRNPLMYLPMVTYNRTKTGNFVKEVKYFYMPQIMSNIKLKNEIGINNETYNNLNYNVKVSLATINTKLQNISELVYIYGNQVLNKTNNKDLKDKYKSLYDGNIDFNKKFRVKYTLINSSSRITSKNLIASAMTNKIIRDNVTYHNSANVNHIHGSVYGFNRDKKLILGARAAFMQIFGKDIDKISLTKEENKKVLEAYNAYKSIESPSEADKQNYYKQLDEIYSKETYRLDDGTDLIDIFNKLISNDYSEFLEGAKLYRELLDNKKDIVDSGNIFDDHPMLAKNNRDIFTEYINAREAKELNYMQKLNTGKLLAYADGAQTAIFENMIRFKSINGMASLVRVIKNFNNEVDNIEGIVVEKFNTLNSQAERQAVINQYNKILSQIQFRDDTVRTSYEKLVENKGIDPYIMGLALFQNQMSKFAYTDNLFTRMITQTDVFSNRDAIKKLIMPYLYGSSIKAVYVKALSILIEPHNKAIYKALNEFQESNEYQTLTNGDEITTKDAVITAFKSYIVNHKNEDSVYNVYAELIANGSNIVEELLNDSFVKQGNNIVFDYNKVSLNIGDFEQLLLDSKNNEALSMRGIPNGIFKEPVEDTLDYMSFFEITNSKTPHKFNGQYKQSWEAILDIIAPKNAFDTRIPNKEFMKIFKGLSIKDMQLHFFAYNNQGKFSLSEAGINYFSSKMPKDKAKREKAARMITATYLAFVRTGEFLPEHNPSANYISTPDLNVARQQSEYTKSMKQNLESIIATNLAFVLNDTIERTFKDFYKDKNGYPLNANNLKLALNNVKFADRLRKEIHKARKDYYNNLLDDVYSKTDDSYSITIWKNKHNAQDLIDYYQNSKKAINTLLNNVNSDTIIGSYIAYLDANGLKYENKIQGTNQSIKYVSATIEAKTTFIGDKGIDNKGFVTAIKNTILDRDSIEIMPHILGLFNHNLEAGIMVDNINKAQPHLQIYDGEIVNANTLYDSITTWNESGPMLFSSQVDVPSLFLSIMNNSFKLANRNIATSTNGEKINIAKLANTAIKYSVQITNNIQPYTYNIYMGANNELDFTGSGDKLNIAENAIDIANQAIKDSNVDISKIDNGVDIYNETDLLVYKFMEEYKINKEQTLNKYGNKFIDKVEQKFESSVSPLNDVKYREIYERENKQINNLKSSKNTKIPINRVDAAVKQLNTNNEGIKYENVSNGEKVITNVPISSLVIDNEKLKMLPMSDPIRIIIEAIQKTTNGNVTMDNIQKAKKYIEIELGMNFNEVVDGIMAKDLLSESSKNKVKVKYDSSHKAAKQNQEVVFVTNDKEIIQTKEAKELGDFKGKYETVTNGNMTKTVNNIVNGKDIILYTNNPQEVKDAHMTKDSDISVVIWDNKSVGSLNNIKRAKALNKPVLVYKRLDDGKLGINTEASSITLSEYNDMLEQGNKRVFVSGSREFTNKPIDVDDFTRILKQLSETNSTIIVGDAKGIDSFILSENIIGDYRSPYEIYTINEKGNKFNDKLEGDFKVKNISPKNNISNINNQILDVSYRSKNPVASRLSNLSYRPFEYNGKQYRSVEHAYQTLKSGQFDDVAYNSKQLKPKGKLVVNKDISYQLMEDLIYASIIGNRDIQNLINQNNYFDNIDFTHTLDKGFWRTNFPKALKYAINKYKNNGIEQNSINQLKQNVNEIEKAVIGNLNNSNISEDVGESNIERVRQQLERDMNQSEISLNEISSYARKLTEKQQDKLADYIAKNVDVIIINSQEQLANRIAEIGNKNNKKVYTVNQDNRAIGAFLSSRNKTKSKVFVISDTNIIKQSVMNNATNNPNKALAGYDLEIINKLNNKIADGTIEVLEYDDVVNDLTTNPSDKTTVITDNSRISNFETKGYKTLDLAKIIGDNPIPPNNKGKLNLNSYENTNLLFNPNTLESNIKSNMNGNNLSASQIESIVREGNHLNKGQFKEYLKSIYNREMNNPKLSEKQKSIISTSYKSLIGLINNIENLDVVLSKRQNKQLGVEVVDKNNREITLILFNNQKTETPFHELTHAILEFAFRESSNEVNILKNELNKMRQQVERDLDSNPAKRRELGLSDEQYEYIFKNKNGLDRILHEFAATFYTNPKLATYLDGMKYNGVGFRRLTHLEGNTLFGKGISLFKALAGIVYDLMTLAFLRNDKSMHSKLDKIINNLSQFNTKEGVEIKRQQYEKSLPQRANRAIKTVLNTATLGIFMKADNFAKKKGLDEVTLKSYKQDILDTIKDTRAGLIASIEAMNVTDSTAKKALISAIGILKAVYAMRHFAFNPIKRNMTMDILNDFRQQLVEGTIFDFKMPLDFNLIVDKGLAKMKNALDRILSANTSFEQQAEQNAQAVKEEIKSLIYSDKFTELSKITSNMSNEEKKAYEIALTRAIFHIKPSDFFYSQEGKLSTNDIKKLIDYMMNHKQSEIIKDIKLSRDKAFYILNKNNDSEHSSRFRDYMMQATRDLAFTRISGLHNKYGLQNAEQIINDIIKIYESKTKKEMKLTNEEYATIAKELHKMITLNTIYLTNMSIPEDSNMAAHKELRHINDSMKVLRDIYHNGNKDMKIDMTRLLSFLIQFKHNADTRANKQRILDPKIGLEHYREGRNITNQIFLNHSSTPITLMKKDIMTARRVKEYISKGFKIISEDSESVTIQLPSLYKEVPTFDRNFRTAYYKEGYMPVDRYNPDVQIAVIDPNEEGYEKELKRYKDMGYEEFYFENFALSPNKETAPLIYLRYKGVNNYNEGRARLGYYFTDREPAGGLMLDIEARVDNPTYYDSLYNNMKDLDGIEYAQFYNDGSQEFRRIANSNKKVRQNISRKDYEDLLEPNMSILNMFYNQEHLISRNQTKDFINNQTMYSILMSNEDIKKRTKGKGINSDHHHAALLFTIEDGKIIVNETLANEYELSFNKDDLRNLQRLFKAMNYDITDENNRYIYVDTRLLPMYFGYEKPNFGRVDSGLIQRGISTAMNALRGAIKETRNNVIIRNPSLVWENFKSNIIGLVGEGIPIRDIFRNIPIIIEQLKTYQELSNTKSQLETRLSMLQRTTLKQNPRLEEIQLELYEVNKNLAEHPLHLVMQNGFYSNIIQDSETMDKQWDNDLINKASDKLGLGETARNYLKDLALTTDSNTYNFLADATRLGDFVPRVIYYNHMIANKGMTKAQAIDAAREKFVNYNTPIWSPVLRWLDYFGFTNYIKYKMAIQKQVMLAFANNPLQASGVLGVQLAGVAMKVKSPFFPSSYLAESILTCGNLPSGFLSGDFKQTAANLIRWNNIL